MNASHAGSAWSSCSKKPCCRSRPNSMAWPTGGRATSLVAASNHLNSDGSRPCAWLHSRETAATASAKSLAPTGSVECSVADAAMLELSTSFAHRSSERCAPSRSTSPRLRNSTRKTRKGRAPSEGPLKPIMLPWWIEAAASRSKGRPSTIKGFPDSRLSTGAPPAPGIKETSKCDRDINASKSRLGSSSSKNAGCCCRPTTAMKRLLRKATGKARAWEDEGGYETSKPSTATASNTTSATGPSNSRAPLAAVGGGLVA
mmetsp:Transcript_53408/g.153198  ORF Transcript_53408/g.153198 Transcript_53408/m.153198 type:complete len:259 (-) Transcript_53408:1256-2032(-)